MNLENLNLPNLGNDNLAGNRNFFYVIDADNVSGAAWPAGTEFEDSNAIALADLTIASGGVKKIEAPDYMSEVRDEKTGESGNHAYQNIFEFALSKTNKKHLGFLRQTTNSRLIFIVPSADGKFRLVGNDTYPCISDEGSVTTSKKPGDGNRGSVNTWYSFGPGPALILDTTVAALDALAGSASGQ